MIQEDFVSVDHQSSDHEPLSGSFWFQTGQYLHLLLCFEVFNFNKKQKFAILFVEKPKKKTDFNSELNSCTIRIRFNNDVLRLMIESRNFVKPGYQREQTKVTKTSLFLLLKIDFPIVKVEAAMDQEAFMTSKLNGRSQLSNLQKKLIQKFYPNYTKVFAEISPKIPKMG